MQAGSRVPTPGVYDSVALHFAFSLPWHGFVAGGFLVLRLLIL
jgi:hypothetical protein